MRRKTICFIDDDPNELDRFDKAINKQFNVIIGKGYSECKEKLKKQDLKKPDLWVLDLFFPKNGITNTTEQKDEMNKRYSLLSKSIREFRAYLEKIGQGSRGGIDLLNKCKKDSIPVVFLTRKGMLEDAIQCIDSGAKRVLKKPMPPNLPNNSADAKKELDKAMVDSSPNLVNHFNDVISEHSHWNRYRQIYMLFIGAFIGLMVKNLYNSIIDVLFQ
ncbi:MAG: response regulator [candidate division Zixibacteria bacterium]|nr:response regulator [candidate division Zixibacteria bacterium]